ncbi:MAG TPA: chaperone modulator CbpM [Candidatus Baltobacteraceae bacterium]|nr:chaperone modulator CbpM [Candidatus Baltobacteraceae bacterium]
MTTPIRSPLKIVVYDNSHQGEVCLSSHVLAEAAGITPTRLARLVRLGLIEPIHPGSDEFTAAEALRLKRMLRLHRDLGVNLTGAAIIVDLVARLESLEAQLAALRGRP